MDFKLSYWELILVIYFVVIISTFYIIITNITINLPP